MKNRDGFTLLELIIVVLLIIIILGISTVFFANILPKGKFDTLIRDISSTIRLAKALSQASSDAQTVVIDLDSKRYGIEGRAIREIPPNVDVKIADPFLGEIVRGRYEFGVQAGVFEGGAIILSDGKRSARINIDPVVGAVVER